MGTTKRTSRQGRRAAGAGAIGKAKLAGKRPRATAKVPPKRKKARAAPAKRAAPKRPASRADFGAPIDGFFARQPTHLRAILEELRRLVREEVPDAESSLKWGMPFFTVQGTMVCALGGHKSHVNLILSGPSNAFDDPDGRLQGESKLGRHLKLTALAELPHESVRGWVRISAALARRAG